MLAVFIVTYLHVELTVLHTPLHALTTEATYATNRPFDDEQKKVFCFLRFVLDPRLEL